MQREESVACAVTRRASLRNVVYFFILIIMPAVVHSCVPCHGFFECLKCFTIQTCTTFTAIYNPPTYDPPDDCPCFGSASGAMKVGVHASTQLSPSTQYCFLKVEFGSGSWTSPPQPFGVGANELFFTGAPSIVGEHEVTVCIVDNLADAQTGDPGLADQISKTYAHAWDCTKKKCPLIEYDCMIGRDIRGGNQLFDFIKARFTPANAECSLYTDQTNLTDVAISSIVHLTDYSLTNWRQKFILNQTLADFCLMGVKTCVNRADFYGIGRPLSNSAVGLSSPVVGSPPGDSLGDRGSFGLVFKHDLDSVLNTSSQQKGYNRTAVHELGHAMAALTHPDSLPVQHNGGAGANCVMNYLEFYADGRIKNGRESFCNKCKTNFENWNWDY